MLLSDSESEAGNNSHCPPWAPAETTLILKCLPEDFTTRKLLGVLHAAGFEAQVDFCYVPMNFSQGSGLGYGFVNLTSEEATERFSVRFSCFQVERVSGAQGLSANIERYRNSAVLHDSVPREFKPVLLLNGVEVPFPGPTKIIKAPKHRKFGRC